MYGIGPSVVHIRPRELVQAAMQCSGCSALVRDLAGSLAPLQRLSKAAEPSYPYIDPIIHAPRDSQYDIPTRFVDYELRIDSRSSDHRHKRAQLSVVKIDRYAPPTRTLFKGIWTIARLGHGYPIAIRKEALLSLTT
jgi:hypothetical protein